MIAEGGGWGGGDVLYFNPGVTCHCLGQYYSTTSFWKPPEPSSHLL